MPLAKIRLGEFGVQQSHSQNRWSDTTMPPKKQEVFHEVHPVPPLEGDGKFLAFIEYVRAAVSGVR